MSPQTPPQSLEPQNERPCLLCAEHRHWLHQPEDPTQECHSEGTEIGTAHVLHFAATLVAETPDFQRLWWSQAWAQH